MLKNVLVFEVWALSYHTPVNCHLQIPFQAKFHWNLKPKNQGIWFYLASLDHWTGTSLQDSINLLVKIIKFMKWKKY